MKIAGGTYREICREYKPYGSQRVLAGSGLRAAAVLRQVANDLEFISPIDAESREDAEVMASTFGLDIEWKERDKAVAFEYHTPLSSPVITGPDSKAESFEVSGDVALVFGMLECQPTVDVKTLVFDPQKPRGLTGLNLDGIDAERLAIVANAAETRAMSGTSDLEEGAKIIFDAAGADVVITKRAARGALVTTSDGQEMVGPWPTERVWPIGSGDVFAAGFAWAWGEREASPVEAARVGSFAASRWCSRNSFDLSLADFTPEGQALVPEDGRVYLAAPFFDLAQRWLVDLVRDNLIALGGAVFSPLHDVGPGDDEVAAKDLAGLAECSAVLGLVDGSDSGTVFEAGWALRTGTPVVIYSESVERRDLKMLRGAGAEACADLSTAVYRALWKSMGADAG